MNDPLSYAAASSRASYAGVSLQPAIVDPNRLRSEKLLLMKIAYLVINERIIDGYLQSQVVDLVTALARQGLHPTVVNVVNPVAWVRNRARFAALRKSLREAGVTLKVVPLAVPYRLFQFRPHLLAWARYGFGAIVRSLVGSSVDVLHARSYFSGWVATSLRDFDGRVVFDLRSLLVDEYLSTGQLEEGSARYQRWRELEAETLRAAAINVVVSDGMKRRIDRIAPEDRNFVIPICVDVERFAAAQNDEVRRSYRARIGVAERPVYVFQGNLGVNKFDGYLLTFERIRRLQPDAFFLVLCQSVFHASVHAQLAAAGIGAADSAVFEVRPAEMPAWLQAADFGLQTMMPAPDSDTRLGIKFVEYLASGLAVVSNRYAGAAADYCGRHGVGVILNFDDSEAQVATAFAQLQAMRNDRDRRTAFARDAFSVDAIATAYRRVYDRIAGRGESLSDTRRTLLRAGAGSDS